HGAAWVQVLAACRLLGLGVTATKAVGAFACAMGALLVDAIHRRYFRGTASPAWVIVVWIAAAPLLAGFPETLWNPAMLPLASALFFYFLFRFLDRASWGTAIVGAVSLGIMCDVH